MKLKDLAGGSDFNLTEVPEVIIGVNSNLICFTGYMQDCFTIPKSELDFISKTTFVELRNEICQ